MFTNGHHQSSTHVALVISELTYKIREAHREQRKWNISAAVYRSMSSLQTMLFTQLSLLLWAALQYEENTYFSCILYAKKKHLQGGNYLFIQKNKIETDQSAAGLLQSFYFIEKRSHCKY